MSQCNKCGRKFSPRKSNLLQFHRSKCNSIDRQGKRHGKARYQNIYFPDPTLIEDNTPQTVESEEKVAESPLTPPESVVN